MAWGFFRKAASPKDDAWWADAQSALLTPSTTALEPLRQRLAPVDQLDERERQEEMLDAIARVQAAAGLDVLPVLETQHRVIGSDICHFMAPVSAPDHGDASGKLFLTSHRVIFAGGASIAWPWHRVRRAARLERDIVLEGGDALTLRLRCNSYGDAAVAALLAARLSRR